MIELLDARKVFVAPDGREVVAVDGVSLEVPAGQTLCLIGTSGSGKTTTMKMINRLVEPTSGTVRVDGDDVTRVDPIRLRRRIGWVIQRGGLFPHKTVAENVGILCRIEQWDPTRIAERIDELLNLVSLDPAAYRDRYPRELSGGERQRVGVARALALDPDYLLMDEPFGALDPVTRRDIHREFLALESHMQKTIVLVTHDMAEAIALGDRIALMDQGRVLQIGTPEDFVDAPADDYVRRFVEAARPAEVDR